jgi:hypothetical protein
MAQPLPEDWQPTAMDQEEVMFRLRTHGW